MPELFPFRFFEASTVVFETIIVYQYISGLFGFSTKKQICYLCCCFFCIGLIVLSLYVCIPAVQISYTLLGIYLLELLSKNLTVATRFFSILYFAIIMIVSEMLCSAIVSALWNLELANTLEFGLSRVLSIVIAKMIQFCAIRLTVSIAQWKKDNIDYIEFNFILPMLLCQICCIMLAYYIFIMCFYCYGRFNLGTSLSVCGILYINVIIFWYFDRIKKAYRYKAQVETMETRLKLQEEYYRTLADHQKETLAIWHDMKKHVNLMKELTNANQDVLATKYLDDLQQNLRQRLRIVQTEDPIIGALLTEQLKRADRDNIILELDVHLGSKTKLQPIDICIILGNLFDNAFEACGALSDKRERIIRAEIKQREQLLFIKISNSYSPMAHKSQRNGKHGYGLNNIKKVVSRYSGQFNIEKSETEFSATILIP